MDALDFGGSIHAIHQPRHRNHRSSFNPNFKFTWISSLKRVTRNERFVVGTVLLSWVVQFDSFGDRDPSPSREHKGTAANRETILIVPVGFWRDGQKLFGVRLKFWHVGIDLARSPLPVNKDSLAKLLIFPGDIWI